MHAVLNALSQDIPALAWAYSRKFKLLQDLGWEAIIDLRSKSPSEVVEASIDWLSGLDAGIAVGRVQRMRASSVARLSEAVVALRSALSAGVDA